MIRQRRPVVRHGHDPAFLPYVYMQAEEPYGLATQAAYVDRTADHDHVVPGQRADLGDVADVDLVPAGGAVSWPTASAMPAVAPILVA